MKIKNAKNLLLPSHFSTSDFFNLLKDNNQNLAKSTVYKLLDQLCVQQTIKRLGRGEYTTCSKKDYSFELSDIAKKISSIILQKYPLVNFQIWELYQMNEFVNHQIAHNTIIVDVEDMLDETIFNMLYEKYPHTLLNPSAKEYYKYSGENTIVVKKMISETPAFINEYHLASLEKIMVDLLGKGITGLIISKLEYKAIFQTVFTKYNINTAMMYRYARRRSVEKEIKAYVESVVSEEVKND